VALHDLAEPLAAIVGPGGVLDRTAIAGRSPGWFPGNLHAGLLVRPRTTQEVSRVMALCHAAGQKVVVHGGLTGLVRGATTTPGDLILSTERMTAIEEVDPANRTMTVQAGVVLQSAQEAAEAAGLFLPLDLAARGSCTIGGNVSTNAGGNRVIRYGMTRDCVLGLEVVLADGTVLSSMNRMIKNNAGYDLKHLFVGSEGTLGIVTRVVLRVREKPASEVTALAAAPGFAAVAALLKHMDHGLGGTLSAFEVMWPEFYAATAKHVCGGKPPLPHGHPYYIVIDSLGADQEADRARFEATLGAAMEKGLVNDAVIAESRAQAETIWAVRDHSEHAETEGGPTITFDVSLPIGLMGDYVAAVQGELDGQGRHPGCFTFGHLGDGNLHFMVPTDETAADRHAIERVVYERLETLGGSISAEHGIGLEKRDWLGISRSPAEIAVMRAMKQALDPGNLLNPGKVLATL